MQLRQLFKLLMLAVQYVGKSSSWVAHLHKPTFLQRFASNGLLTRPAEASVVAGAAAGPRRPKAWWSPSDLMVFMQSPFASWMERLAREHPAHPWVGLCPEARAPDPLMAMLAQKGAEAERRFLDTGVRAILVQTPPSPYITTTTTSTHHPPPLHNPPPPKS